MILTTSTALRKREEAELLWIEWTPGSFKGLLRGISLWTLLDPNLLSITTVKERTECGRGLTRFLLELT